MRNRPLYQSQTSGLMIVAAALCLCVAINPGQSFAQAPAALVRADAVAEEVLSQTIPILGRVVAQQRGDIASRITGPIAEITARVGGVYAEGDVLAVIDPDRLRLELNLAEAEWAIANAEIETVEAQLAEAELELRRMSGLQGSAAFSQARFENAEVAVVRTRSEIAEARARRTRAAASLNLARLNLERAEIRAPYNGVVIARMAQPGNYVSPGDTIVTMIDTANLEIEADVPFNRLPGLTPGLTVNVLFDGNVPGRAKVRAVVPLENPLTRTRAVRFDVVGKPADFQLSVEGSVTVEVPVGGSEPVLTVHKDAVIQRPDGAMVFVLTGPGDGAGDAGAPSLIAQPRPIRTGESVGDRFEVLDGLAVDELVVTRGNERLRPGQPVQIEPTGAAPS